MTASGLLLVVPITHEAPPLVSPASCLRVLAANHPFGTSTILPSRSPLAAAATALATSAIG
jgi:hypothetical protein